MTQETIKKRLRAARKLIEQPEKWTQGAFQRDAHGHEVAISHTSLHRSWLPRMGSHCALGAISVCCRGSEEGEVKRHLMDSINGHGPIGEKDYYGLTGWNDLPDRTHAEVMLAFDRAIEEA